MITGQDLGAEPEKWKTWWTDQLGYVYQSNIPETKPTLTDTVIATTPFTVGTSHTACFAAGTLVATMDGPRAIESIQVGDRVLAQDTTTGLARLPAGRRRAPQSALADVPDRHRRRDDRRHRHPPLLEGRQGLDHGPRPQAGRSPAGHRRRRPEVRSIEPDATQPVYNLDVAENRDFFVGSKGLLVHDFSFVQPVMSPFDRSSSVIGH